MKAYPLTWPKEWPRTAQPSPSQFKTTLNSAISNVQGALVKFSSDSKRKVENILISSNVTLMDQKPKDAGVAMYFTWDGISTCIAVDRYQKVEDNLQAIFHCIEAERTKLRHGGLNLVRAAFRGYAALPSPTSPVKDPWSILGIPKTTSRAAIEYAYREKAKTLHPDTGGSVTDFQRLKDAKEIALKDAA